MKLEGVGVVLEQNFVGNDLIFIIILSLGVLFSRGIDEISIQIPSNALLISPYIHCGISLMATAVVTNSFVHLFRGNKIFPFYTGCSGPKNQRRLTQQ